MFDLIGIDADDTLWHNIPIFLNTQSSFCDLLASYQSREWIQSRLYEIEMRNLEVFGYGVKGFILSMIETAIEITEGKITGQDIHKLIGIGKAMIGAPIALLDGVEGALEQLARDYTLMVVTKGDLLDQEAKVARSGIGRYFEHVEVLSRKTPDSYMTLLRKYSIEPARFLMVGNSLNSDVLPVLQIGGQAVHIEYHETWEHERPHDDSHRGMTYHVIDRMGDLPRLLDRLAEAGSLADRPRRARR